MWGDFTIFLLSISIIDFYIYFLIREILDELLYFNRLISNGEDIKRSREFLSLEFEILNSKLIQLLRKVEKREKKKRKYIAKIKLKNQQRSNIISAIAHEFRNPISSIMGYAQTINEDENIPPKLRKKFLNKIYTNGQKIERLLRRLILWNRFESGTYKLQKSRFDILDLIKEVISLLEDSYRDRSIIVSNRSLIVEADRALIEVVLYNLIENALKYSKGDIFIDIKGGSISIKDNGIGISKENIEKITKKFFRVNNNSWDNSMGLGLAIVRQILSLHNSRLEIKSQEHFGSIFSFKL